MIGPIQLEAMENLEPGRSVIENLMRCPLCGAINAATNAECFCCAWQGQFDHDEEAIQAGIDDLLTYCPELEDMVGFDHTSRPGVLRRFRAFLTKLFWPDR